MTKGEWLVIQDLAICSIIGGNPELRLQYATKLRRLGVSTFFEYRDRKRDRMRKRAIDECAFGKGGVYDLDDEEDRAWLDRGDLEIAGV